MKSRSLAASPEPLPKVDPFEISVGLLMVIAFNKSSSANFPLALTLAKTARWFAEADVGGREMFVVGFAKDQADAGRASAFLRYASSWKGVMVFSDGALLVNTKRLTLVLDCFMQSCACRDPSVHCHERIADPFHTPPKSAYDEHIEPVWQIKWVEIPQKIFPCQLLRRHMSFRPYLKASVSDQIQAAAVEHGCVICPRFDPDYFPDAGTITVERYGLY